MNEKDIPSNQETTEEENTLQNETDEMGEVEVPDILKTAEEENDISAEQVVGALETTEEENAGKPEPDDTDVEQAQEAAEGKSDKDSPGDPEEEMQVSDPGDPEEEMLVSDPGDPEEKMLVSDPGDPEEASARASDLEKNLEFSNKEFAEKLLTYMKGDGSENDKSKPIDWSKLSGMAVKCFRRTPTFNFLYGTFDGSFLPKGAHSEQAKQEKEEDELEDVAEPEQPLDEAGPEPNNDAAVEPNVVENKDEARRQYIMTVLQNAYEKNGNKPISFLHLVINPQSFVATANDLLQVMTLLTNGRVELTLDEKTQMPYIAPAAVADAAESEAMAETFAGIMTINYDLWEEFKAEFGITEAMLDLNIGYE